MITGTSSKHLMKVFAALVLGLMTASTINLPVDAQFKPPKRPTGNDRDGADRGSCEVAKSADTSANDRLTALIPINGKVNTSVDQPILWFYIPFSSASQLSAALILQNIRGKEVARTASIPLSNTPGIISIKLPQPLPQNAPHRFFLSVNCAVAGSRKTLEVSGWINWVKPNPNLLAQLKSSNSLEQTANLYAQAGYWSDTLTLLARNRDKDPEAAKLWTELFQSEELDQIRPKPILSCCGEQRGVYRQLPTRTKGAQ